MTTVKVRADTYRLAAANVRSANHIGAIWYDDFCATLNGFGAMAGDDSTSAEFAQAYDEGAREAMGGFEELVEGAGNLSVLLETSATNHRNANRDSAFDLPLYTGDDPLPDEPVEVTAYAHVSAEGGDDGDLPEFWNLIQDHLEGFAWPNADTGKLREAAEAWRNKAANVLSLQSNIELAMNHLEEIESPEVPTAVSALQEFRGACADVALGFTDMGDACESYADDVEHHREVIKGILRDLAIEAGISAVAGVVTSFFTFGGGAAAGTAIAGWRAVAAARKVVTALRALKDAAKLMAIAKLTAIGSKLRPSRLKLVRFRQARKIDAVPTRPQRVKGKLPKKGEPNSYGYDENGDLLPYANSRPGYAEDQVQDVWEDAQDANGDVWVLDKFGDRVKIEWEPGQPRRDVWDMGHIPEAQYRDLLDDYLSHRITKEEFLEEYRDPDNYRVEHPGRNRSRVDEGG